MSALPESGPRVKAYFALGMEMHEMAGVLKDCRRYLTQFGAVDPELLKQQIDDALAMYELREAQANAELQRTA